MQRNASSGRETSKQDTAPKEKLEAEQQNDGVTAVHQPVRMPWKAKLMLKQKVGDPEFHFVAPG